MRVLTLWYPNLVPLVPPLHPLQNLTSSTTQRMGGWDDANQERPQALSSPRGCSPSWAELGGTFSNWVAAEQSPAPFSSCRPNCCPVGTAHRDGVCSCSHGAHHAPGWLSAFGHCHDVCGTSGHFWDADGEAGTSKWLRPLFSPQH